MKQESPTCSVLAFHSTNFRAVEEVVGMPPTMPLNVVWGVGMSICEVWVWVWVWIERFATLAAIRRRHHDEPLASNTTMFCRRHFTHHAERPPLSQP